MNTSKQDLEILTQEESETLIWTNIDPDKEVVGFRFDKYFASYKEYQMFGYMFFDDYGHAYLLTPEMVKKYASSIEKLGFYATTIYGCMTEDKDIFFLPIYDTGSEIQMGYNDKFLELLDAANKAWVKIPESYCCDVAETHFETASFETIPRTDLPFSPDEIEKIAFDPMFIIRNEQHFRFEGIKLIPD